MDDVQNQLVDTYHKIFKIVFYLRKGMMPNS